MNIDENIRTIAIKTHSYFRKIRSASRGPAWASLREWALRHLSPLFRHENGRLRGRDRLGVIGALTSR